MQTKLKFSMLIKYRKSLCIERYLSKSKEEIILTSVRISQKQTTDATNRKTKVLIKRIQDIINKSSFSLNNKLNIQQLMLLKYHISHPHHGFKNTKRNLQPIITQEKLVEEMINTRLCTPINNMLLFKRVTHPNQFQEFPPKQENF